MVLFVLGLGLLIAGAEALVRGSAGLAGRFGIEAAPGGQAIQYGNPTKAR